MKNVDQLYEKYYNAYKNDYDADDELSEAKKKKFDYKLFELFDKTDKKSKLDQERKKKFKESQNWLHCQNGCALKIILRKQ